ncbi:MAG: hypothetical protein AseanaTS_04300 [Candidatus Pelagadaptatus aseana]|uniref:c-type cytochrome n=1 Tax=Candidatus Pelagadaptatus aseana TaxID=3120508 RepID=UPI0039B1BD4F
MLIRTLTLIATVALLAGCNTKSISTTAENLTGQDLFEMHCAQCHKASGAGNFLKGVPSVALTDLTEHEISEQILKGKNRMPSSPRLNYEQRMKIARYIKHELH